MIQFINIQTVLPEPGTKTACSSSEMVSYTLTKLGSPLYDIDVLHKDAYIGYARGIELFS